MAAPGDLDLEFTIEPFVPAQPGPHVTAAIDVARAAGLEVAVGPFGTRVSGSVAEVVAVAGPIVEAALSYGATRISMQVAPRAG